MSKEYTACVIIIGNEILSGRTQDANLSYIGKRCDELGIRLTEARVISDDEATIVDTVNHYRANFDYVFTTGGIGPTHDDITSASVALAFGKKIIRHPDAVAVMDEYYDTGQLTEARLKMADVPEDATLIDNPVSAAPGFQLENVFVLPGVPVIMQAMFEGIVDGLAGGSPMLTDNVATNLGESMMAKELGQVQDRYPDISIGSYPYFKKGKIGVNLVLRGTDADLLDEVKQALHGMIEGLGGKVVS